MTVKSKPAALWTCPKCGVKLLTRNLWHSCGLATLDDWKARMGPHAEALYSRFEELIAACGEYHIAPAKTRIAFLALIRFAAITRLNESEMVCGFAMPKPLKSKRFAKVEEVVPGWFVHSLRVAHPAELDAEVQGWIRESYRLMGMRQSRPATSQRRSRGPKPRP